jgi:hypothetical protein
MLNAIKRLTGWPWFVRADRTFLDIGRRWENDKWFLEMRADAIDLEIATTKSKIETAKRMKRARKHLYAKLHELTTERLRIERGL